MIDEDSTVPPPGREVTWEEQVARRVVHTFMPGPEPVDFTHPLSRLICTACAGVLERFWHWHPFTQLGSGQPGGMCLCSQPFEAFVHRAAPPSDLADLEAVEHWLTT